MEEFFMEEVQIATEIDPTIGVGVIGVLCGAICLGGVCGVLCAS
ncbi:hypothetical protein ACR76T_12895 [Enterococcus faecalis]|nr:hypothetical protein [Enterococcus faecalis]